MTSKNSVVLNMEVKNALRRLSFPESAREALKKIEQVCIAQNTNRTQSSQNIKQMELAMEIISEFIFCENSGKSFKKKNQNTIQSLSKIQELQLLDMLCDYMSSNNEEGSQVIKNAVYMFLFPHSHPQRSQVLVKLVSMSISLLNYQVLISTGILMQQVGCTTKFSIEIGEGFVKDYFNLLPQNLTKLKDLPLRAPLFTTNLLTALSEMYNKCSINENLLLLITDWIGNHIDLCYTALITNLSSSLPNGAIPMPAVTPFVGLFKWCILSPFYNNCKLYSKLHLSLLSSLLECKQYCITSTQRNIICAESLCTIVSYLLILIKENESKNESIDLNNRIEESIHRLAQCVQVCIFTQTMYGNKQKLFSKLQLLPKNKLLNCVIETHKNKF